MSDREAATYRQRLRAAESERDGLAERLEGMQRAEAERVAGESLTDAEDLWLSGTQLVDLLDDDGNVNPETVAESAAALVEAKPHLARRRFQGSADGGPRPSSPAPPSRPGAIFSDEAY